MSNILIFISLFLLLGGEKNINNSHNYSNKLKKGIRKWKK